MQKKRVCKNNTWRVNVANKDFGKDYKYSFKKGVPKTPEQKKQMSIGHKRRFEYLKIKQQLLEDALGLGVTYQKMIELMSKVFRGDSRITFKQMQTYELFLKTLQVLTPKDINIPSVSTGSKIVIGGGT
jgi:hypothetical protein